MSDPTTPGVRAQDELRSAHFAIVPEWLLGEAGNVIKLYAVLARAADKDTGRLWPGQSVLAERMGVSDRTVRTLLNRLEEIGALREEKRRWNGTTVYTLLPVRPETSFRSEATDRKSASALSGSQLPPNESHERESLRTPIARGIPLPFDISMTMAEWAVENVPGSIDISAETEAFSDHHAAKGSTFKDWEAAWRKWMRNAAKYQSERQSTGSNGVRMTNVERSWRNIKATEHLS